VAGNQPTPTDAQRRVPGAPDSTMTAQHRLPVSGAGPLTLRKRTPTHAVTGPGAWENGRDQTSTPSGPPPLNGAGAGDCKPDCP
jgi:hypothetical protein